MGSPLDGEAVADKLEGAGEQQEENCLTFLGTFYHDNHNEHNVDLIQFKEPVRLLGIRVIPLGATVNLSNGSFQLGATNPSELELEFYYNDLQDPTKSTFTMMEKFKYQEKHSIHFDCEPADSQIFTDGILVRGLYSTLTLATYGYHVDKEKIKITAAPEAVAEGNVTDEELASRGADHDRDEQILEAGEAYTKEIALLGETSEAASVELNLEKEKLENSGEGGSLALGSEDASNAPQTISTISTRFSASPTKAQPKFESVILHEEKIERISSDDEESFNDAHDVNIDEQEAGRETPAKPCNIVPIEAEDISDEEIICEDEEGDETFSETGSREFSKNKSTESVSSSMKDERKSSHSENLAEVSQDLLSEQDGSFGEDLSEFVEQISDAELDEYTDDEMDIWEDVSFDALSVDYNPLSPSFQIRPLKKMNVESFVVKPVKADKPLRNQVIHNLRKYSEESFKEALMELWVETLEQTLPVLPAALGYIEAEASDCVQILNFWVKLGLDLKLAKTHTAPPFIVRHLKAGLRLTELLASFGGSYLEILFENRVSLSESLFEILDDEMLKASLIQGLICRVMERILDSRRGWDEFMLSKAEETTFQKLERFLQKSVEPRCANVTKHLETKMMLTFRCVAVNELATGIATGLKVNAKQWLEFRKGLDDLRSLTVEYFNDCKTVLEKLEKSTFSGYTSFVGVFRLLQEFEFMKSVAAILYYPEFQLDTSVSTCIVEILQQLANFEIGLIYLCAEGETTRRIIKKLANFSRDNNQQDASSILLSLCLMVQVMNEIDNIVETPPWTLEESEEDNNSLQRLHSLLSTGVGRDALVRIFSMGRQIRNLVRIIKDDYNDDETLRIISMCRRGYAVPLLIHVVKFSDNVDFIKKYGPEIHELVSSLPEDFDAIEKLKEVLPFLKTSLDPSNFTFAGIDKLSQLLESLATESFLAGSQGPDANFGFTPEILTILRIFNGLAHKESEGEIHFNPDQKMANTKELELLQNCVELNSKDIIPMCMKLLKKLTTEFDQESFLSVRLVGLRGDMLISFLLNVVKLVRRILTLVIGSRNFDYHELEPVEVLVDLYGILKHYPSSSKSLQKVALCSSYLVETIGAFAITLPNLKMDEGSEDQLKKCMWTRTISSVLKFILRSPANVPSGLNLLLELLPDASPVISDNPLDPQESQELVMNRRRWGVYMHGVTEEIQEVIGIYCITAEIGVLKKLQLVCLRLAHLSASSCLMICRAVIDKVLQSVENDSETSKVESSASLLAPSERRVIHCSPESCNCLRFLSSLVRGSSKIKTGILHLGRASSKLDEKYAQFIGLLCNILTSFPFDSNKTSTLDSHYQAEAWVVSIFHSLCDANNNVLGARVGIKSENYSSELIFANSLPTKDNLSIMTSALISILQFEHITSETNSKLLKNLFSTLQLLMQTDYGFHHLKSALLNNSSQVHDYLEKLVGVCANASTDDAAISHVFDFVNFLHSMTHAKDAKVFSKLRQNILRSFELRKCFIWSGDTKNHLLEQLRTNLEKIKSQAMEGEADAPTACRALEQLEDILICIRTDEMEYVVKSEVTLPPPESLENLFTLHPRVCCTVAAYEPVDDLQNIAFDEENLQPELITIDLVDLSQEVFKVDLAQLNSFYKIKDIGSAPGARHDSDLPEVKSVPLDDFHNFKSPHGGLSLARKPSFHHHSHRGGMRGAYGRGLSSGHHPRASSHFDPFRSRPPNTSRPPSLHVDDFVAMASSSVTNSRMGGRPAPSGQDPYSSSGRGHRGSSRPYDSDRSFRSHSQANVPYYTREASNARGRGTRGRGWGSSDTRSSPAHGGYGGRQDQGGRSSYGPADDNYRSARSGSTGSGSVGPIRNSHRYTRQYREAPPVSGRSSSSSNSSWREKPRSSYR